MPQPSHLKRGELDTRQIRRHVDGCFAPFVEKECDCPPARLYVSLDDVVDLLRRHGDPDLGGGYHDAALFLEEAFEDA